MHRQHPYAGYSPQAGPGRIDSPPGPGPDRTRGPMSGRGYPPSVPPPRGRGMGRGAPTSGYGYESPYPGPALDNPYGEEAYSNYRENGNEYSNQYENPSGTLLAIFLFYASDSLLCNVTALCEREFSMKQTLLFDTKTR